MNKTGSVKFGILWNSLQQFGQLGITFVNNYISSLTNSRRLWYLWNINDIHKRFRNVG